MTIHTLLRRRNALGWTAGVLAVATAATVLTAQQQQPPQQGQQPTQGRRNGQAGAAQQQQQGGEADHGSLPPAAAGALGGVVAYPDRPKAPQEVLDRGKAAFSVNCSFCHGSDAGGGSVGPNLQRSDVVLQDKNGELILPIVHGARVDRGMPKIDISDAQVQDIAAWLHSIKISSRGGHEEKINIVVGKPDAGKAAFDRLCSSCHSVTGDLQGFAAKFTDPRAMQQAWIMPGMTAGRGAGGGTGQASLKVPAVTATVTEANGTKVTGKLDAIDDFYVAVTGDDGVTHRFTRNNGVPKVEIHDPLAAHREMLRKYDDKDIHDITAYLESLK